MSTYIKLLNLEYPRHQGDIRLEHPEIGCDFTCPNTYAEVVAVPEPTVDTMTHTAYQLAPENINGIWHMVWAIRELTAAEIELNRLYRLNPNGENLNLQVSGSAADVIG
jgi:hypothetical protein